MPEEKTIDFGEIRRSAVEKLREARAALGKKTAGGGPSLEPETPSRAPAEAAPEPSPGAEVHPPEAAEGARVDLREKVEMAFNQVAQILIHLNSAIDRKADDEINRLESELDDAWNSMMTDKIFDEIDGLPDGRFKTELQLKHKGLADFNLRTAVRLMHYKNEKKGEKDRTIEPEPVPERGQEEEILEVKLDADTGSVEVKIKPKDDKPGFFSVDPPLEYEGERVDELSEDEVNDFRNRTTTLRVMLEWRKGKGKPEVGEEPSKPPADERPIEERLEEARRDYLGAKKRYDSISGTRRILGKVFRSESQRVVEQNLNEAEAKYQRARAEYGGAITDKWLGEQEKLLQGRFQIAGEIREAEKERKVAGWGTRFYEWHKGLSRFNCENKLGLGKFGRMVNLRTGVSLGLLGAGLWFGAGTAIGIGAFALRRALSGTAAGFGIYDLSNLAAEKIDRMRIEKGMKGDKADLQTTIEYMARMESRAMFAGRKFEDLQRDQLYRDLLVHRTGLTNKAVKGVKERQRISDDSRAAEVATNYLDALTKYADEDLEDRLMTTHVADIIRKLSSVWVGLGVGSGALAYMTGHKTSFGGGKGPEVEPPGTGVKPPPVEGVKIPPPETLPPKPPVETPPVKPPETPPVEPPKPPTPPETPPVKPPPVEGIKHPPHPPIEGPKPPPTETPPAATRVELTHGGKPTAAVVETKGTETTIHLGGEGVGGASRGIEGALLDLKGADPAKYDKMIKWLEENYSSQAPGGNTSGKLVHRFMLDYAKEHGFSLDGSGARDLSEILEAKIQIGADGAIDIDTGDIDFAPEAEAPETPGGEAPRGPAAETPTGQVPPPPELRAEMPDVSSHRPPSFLETQVHPPETPTGAGQETAELATPVQMRLTTILGEKHEEFFKNFLKFSEDHLTEIKNKSLWDFREHYNDAITEGDETFRGKFEGLADFMSRDIEQNHLSDQELKRMKVGDYIVRVAKAFAKIET